MTAHPCEPDPSHPAPAARMVNMEQPAEFNRIVVDFVSAK
jgi:hypothetical protein